MSACKVIYHLKTIKKDNTTQNKTQRWVGYSIPVKIGYSVTGNKEIKVVRFHIQFITFWFLK
jgi:hypothetical protein